MLYWSQGSSVSKQLVFGSVISYNLLLLGGYNREECLRTVECYDPQKDTWTFIAPMRTPRARFQMAVLMVCVGWRSDEM